MATPEETPLFPHSAHSAHSVHTPQSPPTGQSPFQAQGSHHIQSVHSLPTASLGRAGSMHASGGHGGHGQAELNTSFEALIQSGPGSAVTVNANPLYDAVMTLFGFVKQQAGKGAADCGALREEVLHLRTLCEGQRKRIDDLEENGRDQTDASGLRLAKRDLENLTVEFRNHQQYVEAELTTTGQDNRENARKLQRLRDEVNGMKEALDDKLNATEMQNVVNRVIPQTIKAETEKVAHDLEKQHETLREQTAAQLKELALHVNSVAQRCVTPEQLQEHLDLSEKKVQRAIYEEKLVPIQREISGLLDAQSSIAAALQKEIQNVDERVHAVNNILEDELRRVNATLNPIAPLPARVAALEAAASPNFDASELWNEIQRQHRELQDVKGKGGESGPPADVIQEAFQMIRGRIEELEENREEQGKAAVVISQYFDKLDHLYSLLDLDKRAAAYGAALPDQEEKLGILMALPIFDRLHSMIVSSNQADPDTARAASGMANLFSVPHTLLTSMTPPPNTPPLQALYSLPIFSDLRALIEETGHQAHDAVAALKQALHDLAASIETQRSDTANIDIRPLGEDRRTVSPVRRIPSVGGGGGGGGGGNGRTSPGAGMSVPEAGVELADAQGGATVTAITGGGACYNAGWRVGDHVVAAENLPVHTVADFAAAVRRNQNASLSVSRIPSGNYRPVSGILVLRSGANGSRGNHSWH